MKQLLKCIFSLVLLLCAQNLSAEILAPPPDTLRQTEDSVRKLRKKQLWKVHGIGAGLYGLSLAGLNELWYSNGQQSSFRWFNDNPLWKQVDKIGHAYSAYHIARNAWRTYRFAQIKEPQSVYLGSLAGFVFLTPIEILDGFSPDYGASWGDLLANTAGSALLPLQYALWKEERLMLKWSFHRTGYAHQRPDVLGQGLHEELLKDYNGQTYWLEVAPGLFPLIHESTGWPPWLSVSLGYGAEDMVYAQDASNTNYGLQPTRQWYLSPAIRLSTLKVKKPWLRSVLFVLDAIRLPLPALEYRSTQGMWRWHWFYF